MTKRKRRKPVTAKQRVLAAYPKAQSALGVNGYVIIENANSKWWNFLSDYDCKFTANKAWVDAAKRLNRSLK